MDDRVSERSESEGKKDFKENYAHEDHGSNFVDAAVYVAFRGQGEIVLCCMTRHFRLYVSVGGGRFLAWTWMNG